MVYVTQGAQSPHYLSPIYVILIVLKPRYYFELMVHFYSIESKSQIVNHITIINIIKNNRLSGFLVIQSSIN